MNLTMQSNMESAKGRAGQQASGLLKALREGFSRWRRSWAEQQRFMRDYDASPFGRGVPRRIWRRHGALLVSATMRRH